MGSFKGIEGDQGYKGKGDDSGNVFSVSLFPFSSVYGSGEREFISLLAAVKRRIALHLHNRMTAYRR
jgi:hypothetical protein